MSKRSYRKQIVHTWNEIAPRYHRRVKAGGPGPFESTGKMLSMSGISKGWRVLDVACGTGAVAQQLLRRTGNGGLVLSPLVYFMDTKECSITIQYIDGILVRDLSGIKFDNACRKIGSMAATLHKNGIMHGDMTTSNFLLGKKGMYMIDFGLSISTIKIDDLAVDLRLFKEALSSAHSKRLKSAWNAFLSGYKKTTAEKKTYEKILERVAIIEGRGRYATVV